MTSDIRITAEPNETAGECTFTVDRPVLPGGAWYFGDKASAAGSPLVEKIFAEKDVTAVLVAENRVRVSRDGWADWVPLAKAVGGLIRESLAGSAPPVDPAVLRKIPAAEDIRARITTLFAEQINPAIAGHGGFVELLDVRGNSIVLRMGGGCQGCASSSVTLKQGIERMIREQIPEIGEILDSTDHAAGQNPYYSHGGAH